MFLNFFSVYYAYLASLEYAVVKNMSARLQTYSQTPAAKFTKL